MQIISFRNRILVLAALFMTMLGGMAYVGPIAQDLAYHDLAETRTFLGIPNFGDVISNTGFAIVGMLGLAAIFNMRGRAIFTNMTDSVPYVVFFFAVAVVSIGSGYYHLAPDNARLFWDRLPITIAFMALFSAIVADRIAGPAWIKWLLPVFVLLGLAALLYWDWTETQGHGDLRFYALVQLYPVVALPVIYLLFPKARYTGGPYLLWVVIWYGAAKIFEIFDTGTLALLGGAVSGHSLKHIAAAAAAGVVLRMILASRRAPA